MAYPYDDPYAWSSKVGTADAASGGGSWFGDVGAPAVGDFAGAPSRPTGKDNVWKDTSRTSTTEIPEWMRQGGQTVFDDASRMAHEWQDPGINPTFQGAIDNAGYYGGLVQDQLGGAQSRFNSTRGNDMMNQAYGGMADFERELAGRQYDPATMRRLFGAEFDSGGMSMAGSSGGGGVARGTRDAEWKNLTEMDRAAYTNPYTGEVVEGALGDMGRQQQIAALQRAGAATKAGSFGGARYGVQEGVQGAEDSRQMGNLSGQLRAQAFDAATKMMQGDQQGMFQASSTNALKDADLAKAELASMTQMNISGASNRNQLLMGQMQLQQSADQNRRGLFEAMMTGGNNLGTMDTQRGIAMGNFANAGIDQEKGIGDTLYNNQLRASMMPFGMEQQLAGILGQVPHDTRESSLEYMRGKEQKQPQQSSGSGLGSMLGSVVGGIASNPAAWAAIAAM